MYSKHVVKYDEKYPSTPMEKIKSKRLITIPKENQPKKLRVDTQPSPADVISTKKSLPPIISPVTLTSLGC